MNLRDFRYLKSVTRTGHRTPLLYGASEPDGPWFRLSKRETAWVTANADRVLSSNVTARNATPALADPPVDV